MKKIINGKKYDTNTAMECGSYEYGCGGVKSKFVCKLPSGISVDNYAARRAACSSAIRCR